jgi:pimeloyl-ACP methyl ester carboxylesterase
MKLPKEYQMPVSPLFKTSTSLLLVAFAFLFNGCSSQRSSVVHAIGPSGVKNVLLVHGAWADGSSWNSLITLLHADGYQVTAVQLPLTSLADDVAVVQRALANEAGKTLLVAHSYGGVVITEAGVDPKVTGLVYISAFAPDAGESALALNNTVAATPINNDFALNEGFLTISAAGIAADFAPDLPAADQVTIAATQGPVSAPNALGAAVTHVAWKKVPSWYVIAGDDRVVAPTLEATMAKRMNATTITLQSGHLAMISHAAEVSEFIEKAASSLQP